MELILDVHLITDRGLARERNEDRCGAFTPEDPRARIERGRLFVVADGMGGYADGDVAAELTMEALPASYFQDEWTGAPEALRRAFVAANALIERKAVSEPRRHDMGATAVAAAVVGERAVFAHVGDCRAYRVHGGGIEQLTSDHSWVQERVDAGWLTPEEARVHPYRNVLTRGLGAEADADPTVGEVTFTAGDVLILCSDGLWNVVVEEELIEALVRLPSARDAARALVDLALERGGPDNISVALVRAVGAMENGATESPGG